MNQNLSVIVWVVLICLCFALAVFTVYPAIVYGSSGFLALFMIYLARSTSLVRDYPSNTQTFSFSRTQLAFWTVIVLSSFMILYVKTDHTDVFTTSSLILMGISVGTTSAGNIIDTSEASQPGVRRHQDSASDGWLLDIISDRNGVSMHRVQAVIFNLVYGIIFVKTVLLSTSMPDFSEQELILLGISSGTYIAVKANENK